MHWHWTSDEKNHAGTYTSASRRIAVPHQNLDIAGLITNNAGSDERVDSLEVVANAERHPSSLRRQGALGCNLGIAAKQNPSTIHSRGTRQFLTLQLHIAGQHNRSNSRAY